MGQALDECAQVVSRLEAPAVLVRELGVEKVRTGFFFEIGEVIQLSLAGLLHPWLEDILVAPFEARAARAYGPLRAANRKRNKDALDKLIASHALSLEVTLVTNNEADFRGVPGLQVENWVNNH